MAEDPGIGEKAETFLRLGERLRLSVLARIALAAIVAAGSWYLIEHRETAVPALLTNQLIVTLSAAGLVLLLVAQAMIWAAKRFQAQSDELHRRMQEQINAGRQDLVDYKAEMKAQMADVQAAEKRCQRALVRLTTVLREHGIAPPANTGWGDLPDQPN